MNVEVPRADPPSERPLRPLADYMPPPEGSGDYAGNATEMWSTIFNERTMVCKKIFDDVPSDTTVNAQRAALQDGATPQTEQSSIRAFKQLTDHLRSIEYSVDRQLYGPLASKALWCGNVILWKAFCNRQRVPFEARGMPDRVLQRP